MPDPFISTSDLSDYLGRDVTADDGATIAVDAASEWCRDVGERNINRGTTILTLDGTGTDALPIPVWYLPANTAGTVVVNGSAITDYVLNDTGILFRGTAGVLPRPVWPEGRQNVTVTVDHGWATADVPRSVAMVALSIASRLVVQGVASQESIGNVVVRYGVNATDLTRGEERILRKLRRR